MNVLSDDIQYIVVHSTMKTGILFNEMNYSIDIDKTIVRKNYMHTTLHCGNSGTYIHPRCRNSNSIGVELYQHSKDHISKDVENRAAELIANLMIVCDIPIDNVLRHYDVTHKNCPKIYVDRTDLWSNFKELILDYRDQIIDI